MKTQVKNITNKIVRSETRRFALENKPIAYIISLHIRNMMASYGEEAVLEIIKALFFYDERKNFKKYTANE